MVLLGLLVDLNVPVVAPTFIWNAFVGSALILVLVVVKVTVCGWVLQPDVEFPVP